MAQAPIGFEGQAMLVTGGGRGLGRAQAVLLAARGCRVIVADNGTAMDGEDASRGPAETVVSEIIRQGGQAVACTADLSLEEGAEGAVQSCLDAFGRIDGIAHYASTCPDLGTVDQLRTRDLDMVMRTNVYAGMWLARAAWPHMIEGRYGRILYATSGGIYGALGNSTYAAAKSAMIGLMRCLALEGQAHGVLINAIAPSASTRMTERFQASAYADWFHEVMPPEKVAAHAAWLLSPACTVYGEMFAVGGGRIARITLAENEGAIATGEAIEEVDEMMPGILGDDRFFHPKDLAERSGKVAALFGFGGSLQSSSTFAVKPIEKD